MKTGQKLRTSKTEWFKRMKLRLNCINNMMHCGIFARDLLVLPMVSFPMVHGFAQSSFIEISRLFYVV